MHPIDELGRPLAFLLYGGLAMYLLLDFVRPRFRTWLRNLRAAQKESAKLLAEEQHRRWPDQFPKPPTRRDFPYDTYRR